MFSECPFPAFSDDESTEINRILKYALICTKIYKENPHELLNQLWGERG